MDATKPRTSRGKTLCSRRTAPLKPKPGLNGPPIGIVLYVFFFERGRFGIVFLCCPSSRNQSSNDVAFPHPQSRKDHDRNENKPSRRGVVWNFIERTIDIAEYRNAEDGVNPAKNRTFGE